MESLPFGAPSHLHGGMGEPNEVSDDRTTTELIFSTHKGKDLECEEWVAVSIVLNPDS
jgi:hypothetical protein